jgi:hypothetical protein
MKELNRNDDSDVAHLLDQLEGKSCSPREIALLRIHCLSNATNDSCNDFEDKHELNIAVRPNGAGLASIFAPVFIEKVTSFIQATTTLLLGLVDDAQQVKESRNFRNFRESFHTINRLLRIYCQWAYSDPVLAEELGQQGLHPLLIRLMQFSTQPPLDEDICKHVDVVLLEMIEDSIQQIQDLAGEVAAASRPYFPLNSTTLYTVSDLRQRLPLMFDFKPSSIKQTIVDHQTNSEDNGYSKNDMAMTVLVHQVTSRQSAQVDVGFGRFNQSTLYDASQKSIGNLSS